MNINFKSKIKNFISGAGIVIVGITLASGTSVLSPTSTYAFPYGCVANTTTSNGGTAFCAQGTGQFRAEIGCQNLFGFWETKGGPWKNVGQGASNAGCSFGYFIKWAGYIGRD